MEAEAPMIADDPPEAEVPVPEAPVPLETEEEGDWDTGALPPRTFQPDQDHSMMDDNASSSWGHVYILPPKRVITQIFACVCGPRTLVPV